jgi:hypothetical protein
MRPPEIPDEPPSEPPYLNSTANWYLQPAWDLFAEIYQRCGAATAKFIFNRCIEEAEKQEREEGTKISATLSRRARELTELPTLDEVRAADRRQIVRWYAFWPDRKYKGKEKKITQLLQQRYVELGGHPEGFDPLKLPPIKRRGSVKHNAPNAELRALFDESDPDSAFSREKAKRGGHLKKSEFATTLVPKYGATADHVLANLRYWRKAKI